MTATPEREPEPHDEMPERRGDDGREAEEDEDRGTAAGPGMMMGTAPPEPGQTVPGTTSGGGGMGATTTGGRLTGDPETASGPLADRPDEEADDEPGTGSNMGGRG